MATKTANSVRPDSAKKKLRWRDRRLIVLAWIVEVFVRAALTLLSYNRLRRLTPDAPQDAPYAPASFARRVSYCVNAAARKAPGATCLVRALTARILLAMKGYRADLHVGVACDEDVPLRAHAWLTSGETTITGDEQGEIKEYVLLTSAV